ncbi:MAG: hypothetical protein WCX65_05025 [bacterium]
MTSKDKVIQFIENENAFQVMAELKKNGALTKEDITKAMSMDRAGFLAFMKQRAGVADPDDDDAE